MINLRSRDDAATNAVMIVAMAALVALLVVLIAVPKPKVTSASAMPKEYRDAQIKVSDADKLRSIVEAQVATQTWTIPEQQVGWSALSNVTRLTKAAGLKLVSFRPQRRTEDGTLIKLPYLVTVDGTYLQVVGLVRTMEKPSNKLAVSVVQFASADNSSDRVTASIGIVAYMNPSQEETTKRG